MDFIDHLRSTSRPVPDHYRGVWKRTLLEAPGLRDTTTTVFWMQTSSWHADIRIPANRPDFSLVRNLAECNASQKGWLAGQQGFAGVTEVVREGHNDVCTWHRYLDFQPPSEVPDSGCMRFGQGGLVETGVHANYLENWEKLPGSDNGFAVIVRLNEAGQLALPIEMMLVAGDYVMHVKNRALSFPERMPPNSALNDVVEANGSAALDMTISLGNRAPTGWKIQHSLLPWLEKKMVPLVMDNVDSTLLTLTSEGKPTWWQKLEWIPPG